MSADALASFEAKWSVAQPELPLALRFASAPARSAISAFACLTNEIAQAAFTIAEPEVATSKLHWWAEELAGIPSGNARHPLAQVLAGYAPLSDLPAGGWSAVIVGALAQREAEPASTLDDLLQTYGRFHAPLARIEAVILPVSNVESMTRAAVLCRAFDETAGLTERLARDRLPLPLDLLARHQLSRVDLTQSGKSRALALRDQFSALASGFDAVDRKGLSPLAAIRLNADQRRSRRAARAIDPLIESARNLDRLPLSAVWAGWCAARRMQASR